MTVTAALLMTQNYGSQQLLEVAEKPLRHHLLGLTYTATGYGQKLPTRFMVHYLGRWRRVYSVCISNVSTEYILVGGVKLPLQLSDMYE